MMENLSGATWFRLAAGRDPHGVSCDSEGAFVGLVPLLMAQTEAERRGAWEARPVADINDQLSACYGLPIDVRSKSSGLSTIARAMSRGDMAFAQIALLNLKIPDPPFLAKGISGEGASALVTALMRSRMLKDEWNPERHPRWPMGDTEHHGGEFRPADGSASSAVTPAQATIVEPMPWDILGEMPFGRPTEILPPPLDIPGAERQRPPLVNPFPKKRKCVEEWDAAYKYCDDMKKKGQFRAGRAGPGADYSKCVLGQVSEECGGNGIDA